MDPITLIVLILVVVLLVPRFSSWGPQGNGGNILTLIIGVLVVVLLLRLLKVI